MRRRRPFLTTPNLLIVLAAAVCSPTFAIAQDGGDDCRSTRVGFSCEVFCTEGDPRVPHATLSWKAGPLAEPLSLELTVYKSGLRKGEVAVFQELSKGGDAKQKSDPNGGRTADYRGHDKRDLTWMNVSLIDTRGGDHPAVTLRNLEPNLVYRMRLVSRAGSGCTQSEEAVCRPAPCVVDWVEEEKQ